MSESNKTLFEQLQEILLNEERESRKQLKEKIDDVKQEIHVHKQDLEEFKEEVNSFQYDIGTFKEDVDEFQEDVEEFKEEIGGFKEQVDDFRFEYRQFQNQVYGYQTDVNEFKEEVEEFKEEVEEFQEEIKEFKEEVEDFKEGIEDPNMFKEKVQPVVDEKIYEVKNNFNEVFGEEMRHSIKLQIVESKEDFVEALYPLVGKLVKSYVRNEFEKLLESINGRLESAFSIRGLLNRVKSFFTGVRYEELAIRNVFGSIIEEVFIIHRESGLLIGNYSRNNTADVDMVAGMLTAIKQFSEETFNATPDEELETIEYGSNKVVIQNFYKYYIATVISGVIDSRFKSRLNNHLINFSEKNLSKPIAQIDSELFDGISKKLKLSFYEFEEIN